MSEGLTGNLGDFAQIGLASQPTLKAWIDKQPDDTAWLRKRGKNGDAYEIEFSGAVAAWQAKQAEENEDAKAREDQRKQFALELGLDFSANAAPGLSMAEQNQMVQAELTATRAAILRKEYVKVSSVSAALGDVLIINTTSWEGFAIHIGRLLDLDRVGMNIVMAQVDKRLHAFADRLQNLEFLDGHDGADTEAAMESAALLDGV